MHVINSSFKRKYLHLQICLNSFNEPIEKQKHSNLSELFHYVTMIITRAYRLCFFLIEYVFMPSNLFRIEKPQ